MSTNDNFQNVIIGEPNQKARRKIHEVYSLLCGDLTCLHSQMKELFPGLDIVTFFNFLKAKDPQAWLTEKYAEIRSKDFPGMDTIGMIKAGIMSMPCEFQMSINDINKNINALLKIIQAEEGFIFPLGKLFIEDGFMLNEEFEQALNDFTSCFTLNQKQNEIVRELENITTSLNNLQDFGVLNFSKGMGEFERLRNGLKIEGGKVVIEQHFFYRFSNFGDYKKPKVSNQNALFS